MWEDSGRMEEEYKVGNCKPPKHSQFKKGHSGGGKPKGSLNWKTRIKKIMDLEAPDQIQAIAKELGIDDKALNRDAIIIGLWKRAVKGDANAAKVLMEREDGRPVQPISGDPDNPVIIMTDVFDSKEKE